MCFFFEPFLVNVVYIATWMSKHVESELFFLRGRVSSYLWRKESLNRLGEVPI